MSNNLETTMDYLQDNIGDRRKLADCMERDLWGTGDGEILSDTLLDISEANALNIVWNYFKDATGDDRLLSPVAFVTPSDYLQYVNQINVSTEKADCTKAAS